MLDRMHPAVLDRLHPQRQKLLPVEFRKGEQKIEEEITSLCPSLTYRERAYGYATCMVLGIIISFGSTFRLARLVHGNPMPFAIAYTIGNILSLGSSMFFVGPCYQIETMFYKSRRGSAIAYLGFIALTLVLCFSPNIPYRVLWVMLSVTFQFAALVWYTLSYIPFGRRIFKMCWKRMLCMAIDEVV